MTFADAMALIPKPALCPKCGDRADRCAACEGDGYTLELDRDAFNRQPQPPLDPP